MGNKEERRARRIADWEDKRIFSIGSVLGGEGGGGREQEDENKNKAKQIEP